MASIFMRFPGGRCKALTLSYDDGVEQDIRLIRIMKENGLKGTFNLNSGLIAPEGTVYPAGQVHRRMTLSQMQHLYIENGMEVACHALTHPFLEQLPDGMLAYELTEDRKNLEKIYGGIVRGMAYPFGTYSDRVIAAAKAAGIVYSRTVVSTHRFGIPQEWLKLDATCHHNDPELMNLAQQFVDLREDRGPALFYLWGHSYEFEGNDNWDVIEKFAGFIGGRDNIWYAANIGIYDYVTAFEKLESSVDGSCFHNPTAQTLYFADSDGRNCVLKPGEYGKLV